MPDIKRVAITMLALAGVVSVSWAALASSPGADRGPIAHTATVPQDGAGYLVLRMVVIPPASPSGGSGSASNGTSGDSGQGPAAGHGSQHKQRAGQTPRTSRQEEQGDATSAH